MGCVVQTEPGKYVLDHPDHTDPTRQYDLLYIIQDLGRVYISALKHLDHEMWKSMS